MNTPLKEVNGNVVKLQFGNTLAITHEMLYTTFVTMNVKEFGNTFNTSKIIMEIDDTADTEDGYVFEDKEDGIHGPDVFYVLGVRSIFASQAEFNSTMLFLMNRLKEMYENV